MYLDVYRIPNTWNLNRFKIILIRNISSKQNYNLDHLNRKKKIQRDFVIIFKIRATWNIIIFSYSVYLTIFFLTTKVSIHRSTVIFKIFPLTKRKKITITTLLSLSLHSYNVIFEKMWIIMIQWNWYNFQIWILYFNWDVYWKFKIMIFIHVMVIASVQCKF